MINLKKATTQAYAASGVTYLTSYSYGSVTTTTTTSKNSTSSPMLKAEKGIYFSGLAALIYNYILK